ncbi:hypothetical protein L6452_31764 [Arctium lappa]|uniref:Uncharacterized protein n=1 Tax=Arctium lappa TaxID=4217 RepID=A0ACB8Z6X5_ARCLA|nr:hypothetical protein L6452_31764 [Arctium lappa]
MTFFSFMALCYYLFFLFEDLSIVYVTFYVHLIFVFYAVKVVSCVAKDVCTLCNENFPVTLTVVTFCLDPPIHRNTANCAV